MFVETKVWISDYGYDQTLHAFAKSAGKLGVDQIDLLILHQALPSRFDLTIEAYKALETLLAGGKVRAIGVSNFMPGPLEQLLAATTVIPAVRSTMSNTTAGTSGGGAIYALGIFGAWVWFWQQAGSFWEYVLAIFQGLLWPLLRVIGATPSTPRVGRRSRPERRCQGGPRRERRAPEPGVPLARAPTQSVS